jgi:hypothetical protein
MQKLSKHILANFTLFFIFIKPFAAAADPKQDCIIGGRVFQEAMRSEVFSIAYRERIDWRRVDYHLLPKKTQERIEADVMKMRPAAESIVAGMQKKILEWKRQGMDGDYMAGEVFLRSMKDIGEQYTVSCLIEHQEAKP